MEYKKVLKFLEIISLVFIVISILEIAYIILFNFTEFNFGGNPILLIEFIYSGSIIPLAGTILWIFLNVSMVCFLLVGLFLYKISKSNKIKSRPLAQYMVVIGMVILIAGLIKLNYLVLLGKVELTPISDLTFQDALYDLYITPLTPGIFWVFFISADCCFMIGALFITAIGIKYTLLQENQESSTSS